jgi:hypothetical protein
MIIPWLIPILVLAAIVGLYLVLKHRQRSGKSI